MRIYQCEDTLEGVFTAIYNIYEDKCEKEDTRISLTEELFLFAEYIPVETNAAKAMKVINTLRRKFGEEDYMQLCLALSAGEPEKAYAVYRTIAAGLETGCGKGQLMDNLADDSVNKVFSLARGAKNEYQHLRGFTRFTELENGVLYSTIAPKNNILTFLMPHFSDRFSTENFMIYDENRSLFGVHPAGKDWYLMQNEELELPEEKLKLSDREREYQRLFQYFCHKIAITERENTALQRNMLPLRFREYMTEFK